MQMEVTNHGVASVEVMRRIMASDRIVRDLAFLLGGVVALKSWIWCVARWCVCLHSSLLDDQKVMF